MELERVILAAYGLAGPSDETLRRQAHTWLQDYSTTPEAWESCIQLLESSSKEVQFFCSNILYTKVKKEWDLQSDEFKQNLYGRIMQLIRGYSNSNISGKSVERLCLVVAQISKHSPSSVPLYMSECNSFVQTSLFVCTELVRVLPEECNLGEEVSIDPASMSRALTNAVPSAIDIIKHVMIISEFRGRAFECIQRWAEVGINLDTLNRFEILDPMLSILVNGNFDEELVDSTCKALIACISKEHSGDISSDKVFIAILNSVCHLTNDDVENALSLCMLATAIGENQVDRIVTSGDFMNFVNVLLQFSNHPSHSVAIHTLNFWLLVQDIPLQERVDFFRRDCFLRLLDILVQKCRLGTAAVTGSDDDIDYDIQSYRTSGDGVKDPLISIFYVLGPELLISLGSLLAGTQDWQTIEVCLFIFATVSREAMEQMDRNGPQSAQLRDLIEDYISKVFLPMQTNAATMKSGLLLLGNYAKLIARLNLRMIEQCLQCTLMSFAFPKPLGFVAGDAFCKLAIACRIELAMHPEAVRALVISVEQSMPKTIEDGIEICSLLVDARMKVMEGCIRIICCVKSEEPLVTYLLRPGLERLGFITDKLRFEPSPNLGKRVCEELNVFNTAVRFLDGFPDTVTLILSGIIPQLEPIFSTPCLQSDEDVMDSLFSLLSVSFSSDTLTPHIDSLLTAAGEHFKRSWSPSCITCIGKALEVSQDPSMMIFVTLLSSITDTLVLGFQNERITPKIAQRYFDMLLLYVMFSPNTLFVQNVEGKFILETFLQVGAECLFMATGPVLVFFDFLIQKTLNGQNRNTIEVSLQREGGSLIRSLLIGLCGNTIVNTHKASQVLTEVTRLNPGLVQELLFDVMVQNESLFVTLDNTTKESFIKVTPRFPHVVFKNGFAELSKLCRKQITLLELQSFLDQASDTSNNVIDLS